MAIDFKEIAARHKQYLLTGVSYAVPFIACGGILIAVSLAFAPPGPNGAPDPSGSEILSLIEKIGSSAFSLMFPVLGGFVAYAMASRPGVVPGFIGGAIASMPQTLPDGKTANAGFLGAIFAGLLAGHVVNLFKKAPIPGIFKPIMPILIIPIFGALIVGSVMFVINLPIAKIMVGLGDILKQMEGQSQYLLAAILGAMIAFDMGGPVNKAAFFFCASMIEQGNFRIMGAVAIAICTPPLGLGLATLLRRKLWNDDQRNAGKAALGMGMIGITEGAIPFAAADPIRVLPCIMAGSITGAVIGMAAKVGDHAPHGGPIVLPVVDNRLWYVVAIVVGTLVTAVSINALKAASQKKENEAQSAPAA